MGKKNIYAYEPRQFNAMAKHVSNLKNSNHYQFLKEKMSSGVMIYDHTDYHFKNQRTNEKFIIRWNEV